MLIGLFVLSKNKAIRLFLTFTAILPGDRGFKNNHQVRIFSSFFSFFFIVIMFKYLHNSVTRVVCPKFGHVLDGKNNLE